MANKLCDKLLNGKDQHRDIASIALKTIVAEVSTQSLAQSILVAVTPQLIKGITGPVSDYMEAFGFEMKNRLLFGEYPFMPIALVQMVLPPNNGDER
jgi:hypothetical protein